VRARVCVRERARACERQIARERESEGQVRVCVREREFASIVESPVASLRVLCVRV